MNKMEKEYALRRVGGIYSTKEKAITDKYPELNKCFSKRDKVNAIMSKKAKVKKDIEYSVHHLGLDDVFDWPQNKEKLKSQIECNKKIKALKSETQKVKDEIMLGDSQRALQLLRKFEQS